MQPVICIGAITRNRPRGFSALTESFARMHLPSDAEVMFAFVENDEVANLEADVETFRRSVSGSQVFYEIEPKLGIPVARNRVLDIALREKCDFIAFVDDDETVAEDWLISLYSELQQRSLDLVGGPVRLHPCPVPSDWLQRTVWRGLVRRNARIEKAAARLRDQGQDHKVTVITSNWLARIASIERNGLRFDESLGFSGGSDTRFFRDAKKAGAQTGWSPSALVFEFMPAQRLSLAYQYRRGRDQAIASYHNKVSQLTAPVFVRSLGFIVFKLISAAALLMVSAFNGGLSLVAVARAAGMASGRMQALLGQHSRQYETIQGS